jgi:hypothetical protein
MTQQIPDQMVTQVTQALIQFGVKPLPAQSIEGQSNLIGTAAAMQWTLELAPGLLAELSMIRTSGDDHLLNLVTASETAHDTERWSDLDLYARVIGRAVNPLLLLRYEAELSCFVQGRAKGVEGLIALIPELLTMNRYALLTVFTPWLDLARGQIDLDEAGIRAAAAIVKQNEGGQ